MRYYLDTEFDGHNGPLISLALIREDKHDVYIIVSRTAKEDPWVSENVIPLLDKHSAEYSTETGELSAGVLLREFIKDDEAPIIISDNVSDIIQFSKLINTDPFGNYRKLKQREITFLVKNINAYPTEAENLVRHNAWCDAMALMIKLEPEFNNVT